MGEAMMGEDIFPCRNEEAFPEAMFQLGLKEA